SENNWIIVDAGIGFPFNEFSGIELLFPNIDYIISNKDKIKALVITHSHEDHIGGAIRILSNTNIPEVYASNLTIALLNKKLEELAIKPSTELINVEPGSIKSFGDIKIEFIRTTHSVPDCYALLFETPIGNILLTGDFKFDFTPIDNEHFDIPRIVEAGNKGIKLLISDSTNVERDGFSQSEKTVGPNLKRIFEKTPKRIFISTFSSHIHRIQQIIEAADKAGRKVSIYGYSMEIFTQIAKETGYLNYNENILIPINEALELPHEKIVIITSGSQGEPTSTFAKMANQEHKLLQVIPGDTFIFSANPIPGNERAVSKIQDSLMALGADLVYGRNEHIHVSGHASQQELKLMIALTRPEYFMPAHGDYRMLVLHAEIAASMGIIPDNIFILKNGDILDIENKKFNVIKDFIDVNMVYYDTISGGIVDDRTLKERTLIGQEGLILVYLILDNSLENILSLDVIFKGVTFKDNAQDESITNEINSNIFKAFDRMKKFGTLDINNLQTVSRDITFKTIDNKLYCKPLIITLAKQLN
ncbi:MAG: ribonuclease J, partial [Cyanobacteriota bacterium]